jgi:hypothetical protein
MDKNESKLNEDATIGITALAKIVTYIAWTGLFLFLLFYLADKADMNLIPKKIDPFLLIFAIGISISLAIVITFPLALNETKQKVEALKGNEQSLTEYMHENITRAIGSLILCLIIPLIPALIASFIETFQSSLSDLTNNSR